MASIMDIILHLGGVNYIRWGRITCPDTEGTELLYSGVAAGSLYSQQGGGSNYLCLPNEPNFLEVTPGTQGARSKVYGAEYQTEKNPPALGDLNNHDVPCAACYTAVRGDKIMIPGNINCPSLWTREYYGYLMTERHNHNRNSYECVDVNAMVSPDSGTDHDAALFYFAEIACTATGTSCPPNYEDGYELPCVVCTK